MSELSAADIAARVVAWHNRHPLARRLRLADVHSVGHVALPFHDPAAPPPAELPAAAGSLRERAMARARDATPPPAAPAPGGALEPAFRDDFIPPLSPAEVGAFGARHGIERAAEPVGEPVRRVPARPGTGGLAWRWLLTAELRAGAARTRVLLGAVPGAPVLGRRLWSLPRVGALAALGGAAVALAVALKLQPAGPELPPVTVLPVPAATQAAAPAAPAASALAPAPASAPASAPAAAETASRPVDVEPRLGRIELPPIGGIVDARRRQAAEAASAAAASAAAGRTTAATAPAAAASAPVFALATRTLRTRTESQQIAEALTALLVVPGSPVQRVDVLRAGDDFRVVAWPYPARADAERAQAALLARGHRLQVIAF